MDFNKWGWVVITACVMAFFGTLFAFAALSSNLRQQCIAANNFRATTDLVVLCGKN